MGETKMTENLTEKSLLEKLAELEHKQWAHIINYLLEKGLLHLARYESFRYKQLANTPYEKLSESQKESDRKWARKVLIILKDYMVPRKQLKQRLHRLEQPRAGSIFSSHMELGMMYVLRKLLGLDVLEIEVQTLKWRKETMVGASYDL